MLRLDDRATSVVGSPSGSVQPATIRATASAELVGDPIEDLGAVILDRIVQQRRDRLVLAAAVLEDQRRDGLQVREVRDGRAAPALACVQELRLHQRLRVARAEHGRRSRLGDDRQSRPTGARGASSGSGSGSTRHGNSNGSGVL